MGEGDLREGKRESRRGEAGSLNLGTRGDVTQDSGR